MIRNLLIAFLILIGSLLLASCNTRPNSLTPQADMPNPASVHCAEHGGKLDLRQDDSGGVFGICVFSDGSECDEWAYFRGECEPGNSLVNPTKIPPATVPTAGTINGQIVFYSDRDGTNSVYILDASSFNVTRLTQGETSAFPGPFSPDGTRLLFTGFGLTHSYIGVMNANGSGQTDLTNLPDSDESFPAWSPNGKHIAFTSRRDGNNEIYIMNANGSNPRRLTDHPGDDFAPSWSPDGAWIAFVSDRDNPTGIYSIYSMAADGSGIKRLSDDNGSDYAPAWSPDGSKIAFRSVQNGQSDIYSIQADGSSMIDLTNNPAEDWSPAWSPDGRWIAFQSNRDGNWDIYGMKADGSDPLNLTNNPADDQLPYWKR